MRLLSYRLGATGAFLGVLAGFAQVLFGDQLGALGGDKLHPVQLGLVTVALSAIAMGAVDYMTRRPAETAAERFAAAAGIAVPAAICFTTVGPLWFVPGALLVASLAMVGREWSHGHDGAHRVATHGSH